MKINLTIDVPDHLRKSLAVLLKATDVTSKGLLTRKAMAAYIQSSLNEGADRFRSGFCNFRPLSPEAEATALDAIAYLRANGKTEQEIRAWVWMQWARWDRLNFPDRAGASQGKNGRSSSSHSTNP